LGFTDGSNGIKAKVGSTAKQEDRVDGKIRAKEVTRPVVQPRQCVILPHGKRKAQNG
jgi:hypothetical protein